MFIVVFFSSLFSFNVNATTLPEISAAQGIHNTLNSQATPNYDTEDVRQRVQDYEREQEERSRQYDSIVNNSSSIDRPPINPDDLGGNLNNQELERANRHEDDVDYKTGSTVLYTKKCDPKSQNCNRGAVFTNVKSVIFDYNNRRGRFANVPKSKQPGSKVAGKTATETKVADTKEAKESERGLASENPKKAE